MTNNAVASSEFQNLMAELAMGSEDAAWKITELYTPHIMRAIRATLPKSIRPKADSQDYAQAVWASIILGSGDLGRFETPQQFIAYLATAARNKVIDNYRHFTKTQAYNVRVEVPIDAVDGAGPNSEWSRTGGNDLLQSNEPPASQVARVREQWSLVLQGCTDRDRKIVALRIAGLDLQVIADQCDVNEKTVRRTLNRILDDMRS